MDQVAIISKTADADHMHFLFGLTLLRMVIVMDAGLRKRGAPHNGLTDIHDVVCNTIRDWRTEKDFGVDQIVNG
jgi:hypothetical protein